MEMASSKSNASYHTLISLCNKPTCLNGVITPEAINRLEDELGGIFTVAKMHHYKQGQNMTPCQRHPQTKVQACHQKRNVDTHHTCQPRRVLHGIACSQKHSRITRTVCGRAQDPDEELQ